MWPSEGKGDQTVATTTDNKKQQCGCAARTRNIYISGTVIDSNVAAHTRNSYISGTG